MTLSARPQVDRDQPPEWSSRRRPSRGGEPWVLAHDAATSSVEARAEVAAGLVRADVGRFGWLVLLTCRRVEIVGSGPRPAPSALVALAGTPDAGSMTVHAGVAAVRRLARLAAGLESTVVGEDQVLGQVRRLRRDAARLGQIDGRIVGVLDAAIATGRRARAERPRTERSLAERGLSWLATRRELAGARLLVVGTGPIGAEAARLGRQRGASVTVASRRPDPDPRAGRASRLTLATAAARFREVDLVVVALAGAWKELLDRGLDAAGRLPFVVDLSAPPAVPGPVRAILGRRLVTLDDLAGGCGDDPVSVAYRDHAERLIDEVVHSWSRASRSDGPAVIVALREAAEARRAASLERLWRRLPELSERQRALVELHGRQLVASILHEPTARLRDDPDGHRVDAAWDLFGL